MCFYHRIMPPKDVDLDQTVRVAQPRNNTAGLEMITALY